MSCGVNDQIVVYHRFFLPLLCALCVAAPVFAGPDAATFPPLNPQELEAVVTEIMAMVKTDENQVEERGRSDLFFTNSV
jgi:hypothetical protein